jgi:hypothetical protein
MNFKLFLQETHPFMQRYVRAERISLSILCHLLQKKLAIPFVLLYPYSDY